jgi:hypothetical protein
MHKLNILQYNVHKRKDIMALLVSSPAAQKYDILAIQEPWVNPFQPATYCPSSSPFLPVFGTKSKRSCLLINKKLDPNHWETLVSSLDLCSIRLSYGNDTTWVHSAYSQPPCSYSIEASQYNNPLELLSQLYQDYPDHQHITVGDFNLHHPLWTSIQTPTAHTAADRLVEITIEAGACQLLTPPGLITYPTTLGGTTIDLAFATEAVANRLLECQVAPELDFSSDHQPVSVCFQAPVITTQARPIRCWKKADLELAGRLAVSLDSSRPIRSTTELEAYAQYVSSFLVEVMSAAVPLRRASSFANPWWSSQIASAVSEAKRAQRQWLHSKDPLDKQEAVRLSAIRSRLIREAKQASFRQFIDDEAQRDGLWKLASWSKGKATAPAQVPPLQTSQGRASTFKAKVTALQEQFFPTTTANLSDIDHQNNRPEFAVKQTTSLEEITSILKGCSSSSAPGDDEIPFYFLKALGEPVARALTLLANICLTLQYFLAFLKTSRTIVLRKPGKSSYEAPSAWRPIALLKTIGKVVEKLVAKRIRSAAEEHQLLHPSQMGARATRSTGTALELLTSMIQTVWREGKDQVASLLSLDIAGAFPTVNHTRLVATIQKLGFPSWLQQWVKSFLEERTSTLVINRVESETFEIKAGLPQGSPLSPILFLLYIEELFGLASRPNLGVHTIGFVDDLNLLAYSKSTEQNCATLGQIHERCLDWASRHGMKFAPHKYELIHFTTARKKHNLQATIKVGSIEKLPSTQVKVLGVWLDPKLRWQAHAKVAQKKGHTALGALRRVVASTWGASFTKARLLYNSTVRPVITYGAAVWHDPERPGNGAVARAISKVQNQGLRTVAGAYRATPIRELEKETLVPPIDIYCSELRALHLRRTYSSPVGDFIRAQCNTIRGRLQRRHRRRTQQRKEQAEPICIAQERLTWATQRESELGSTGKKAALTEWKRRWHQEQTSRTSWPESVAALGEPSKSTLKLYSQLKKAESSVLFQARTGRIGLRRFLASVRVPGIESGDCLCGKGRETAEHMLLYCDNRPAATWSRGAQFRKLVSEPESGALVARRLIQSGRLGQFSLASRLLYSQ